MLPLKDTVRSRTFPVINYLLIAVNAIIFFLELSLPSNLQERLIFTFGLVPANLSLINPATWLPLISHQFLHGGWWHFLSNIWVLFIFGDNVEDRLGSGRYLFFYLIGGMAAGLIQTIMTPGSRVPSIGASGAIAAVLGAYFLFYPRSKVITLIPIFFIPWFVELPAIIYLGFWFVMQLFSGLQSLATVGGAANGGIAWWAHIGGFLFGLILGWILTIGKPVHSYYDDEHYPW
jgi:membrane associated rhomboid family serine protease